MDWPLQGEEIEDIGFTVGNRDHLDLRRHHLLRLGECGEPALTFFLGSLALMALMLETDGLRVTCPHLVMKEPERETVGREGEG